MPYFLNCLVPYFFLMGIFNSCSAISIIATSNFLCSRSCSSCFCSSMISAGEIYFGSLFMLNKVILSLKDFSMQIKPWYANTQRLMAELLIPYFFPSVLKLLPPIKYSLIIYSLLSIIYTFKCKPISLQDTY